MTPPGSQQGKQSAPPGKRIGQMVEHADALDDVERPVDRGQPRDVGLDVLDVAQAQGAVCLCA